MTKASTFLFLEVGVKVKESTILTVIVLVKQLRTLQLNINMKTLYWAYNMALDLFSPAPQDSNYSKAMYTVPAR